jgi:hypothetical protein
MVRPLLLLLTLLGSVLTGQSATNTARLSFHCQSVRLHPAAVTQLGQTYRLAFTTVDGEPNGELGIDEDPNAPTIHSTVILLEHPLLGETLFAKLFVDPPELGDADVNRVDDFFQVDRPVESRVTRGGFEDEIFGLVEVTATWSRAAGSASGSCALQLVGTFINATFNVPFEVFQYLGPLTYAPGTNVVAQVELDRQGAPGKLTGQWHLARHAPGELTFPADEWLNETGQRLVLIPADEIEAYLTHVFRQFYNGLAGTFDGLPATPAEEEYIVWEFNVFDENDADDDREPDLSDPPNGDGGPPVTPTLAVSLAEDFLTLQITARAGQVVIIERRPTLTSPNWIEVEAITLLAVTREVTLPLSGDDSDFYRVRTP